MINPVSCRMNEKPVVWEKPGFFGLKVMLKITNIGSLNKQNLAKISKFRDN
jgi:hypothetical protein